MIKNYFKHSLGITPPPQFSFKLLTLAGILCMAGIAKSQTVGVGVWSPSNSTTTQHDVGVGTSTPSGKQEILYCPQASPQDGLIVTAKDCAPGVGNVGNGDGDGPIGVDPNFGGGVVVNPVPVFLPYAQVFPTGLSLQISKNNLLWLREEASVNQSASNYNYVTRFVVTNEGRAAVNSINPRAQLDIVQPFVGVNLNTPTAIFSKRNMSGPSSVQLGNGAVADGHSTSQMMFFNKLNTSNYNSIVQTGDQALIYTDGANPDGTNQTGGLVIAPWGSQGGVRLDPMGNMELRGDLRSTKVVVDAVWWPDFVFDKSYSLRPLEEVKSYIETHKYLPDMPSETVVKSQGQNMGELQKLQQQKIEELTLYTIQQEEKLKAQAAKIAEMEQKLDLILNLKK